MVVPTNRDTSIPILSAKDNNNNFGRILILYRRWLYLRLRNVAIGYTFNNKLAKKVKLRMYLFVQIYSLFQNIQEWILK
jgi:hypothetical protein